MEYFLGLREGDMAEAQIANCRACIAEVMGELVLGAGTFGGPREASTFAKATADGRLP